MNEPLRMIMTFPKKFMTAHICFIELILTYLDNKVGHELLMRG